MSAANELRDAARIKWGIAIFQVVIGTMIIWFTYRNGLTAADFAVCGVLIALGIGLALHVAIARWLALGLCFLYIVAAVLVPPLMFLARPVSDDDRALTTNLLFTAALLAFGGIGYRGLGYYRSELGRFEYRRDVTSLDVPPPESSMHTAASAGVWVLFLAVMAAAGLSVPVWLIRPLDIGAAAAPAAAPASTPAPTPVVRPEIQSLGLCRIGDTVALAYRYDGRVSHVDEFEVEYTNYWRTPGSRGHSTAKLPPPGEAGVVALGDASALAPERGGEFLVEIDIDPGRAVDRVENLVKYPISWAIMPRLPACDSPRTD